MTGPLDAASHRSYPPPARPWVMHMTWRHLLFAHWPVPVDALRAHIPASLDVDTHDGTAWLGIVPFLMDNTRPRALPAMPGTSTFPELNVRTYVTPTSDPTMTGVWFFSLDAASRLAVRVARRVFHLPYFDADMHCDAGDDTVRYQSSRTHARAPGATFDATYTETGSLAPAPPGSLEHFLTERYCLYASNDAGVLFRGHIHHPPWSLSHGSAELRQCDMTALLGMSLPRTDPLLHVAQPIDVIGWWPEVVR